MVKIKIDKIVRSRRKTLGFEVSRDASLIVRAPERASIAYIEGVVYKKRFWINKRQRIARERSNNFIPKQFVTGEGFLYLGDTYRLVIVDNTQIPFTFDKEFQLARNCLSDAREIFVDWYKKEAYKKIKERLGRYSDSTGLQCNKFNITNAKKRWGSCSVKGNLYFSWRLIMAPLGVIDYVAIHELVHLDQKNHSRTFWNKVKAMMPEYKKYQKWLKENEHLLII